MIKFVEDILGFFKQKPQPEKQDFKFRMEYDLVDKPQPIYYAKVIEEIKNGKGYWSYDRVGIYEKTITYTEPNKHEVVVEKYCGEYTRNYHSFAESTFAPFEKNGQWYALYSKNYTATRVMTLPDCKDWCGEENNSDGFCPVELYVPAYIKYRSISEKDGVERIDGYTDEYKDKELHEAREANYKIYYRDTAFVAGCVWGDDSSWKIQAFDLSRIEEKILTAFTPFGYFELPGNQSLKEAISYMYEDRIRVNSPIIFQRIGKTNKYTQVNYYFPEIKSTSINQHGDLILETADYNINLGDCYNELKNALDNITVDKKKTLSDQIKGKSVSEAEKILTDSNYSYVFYKNNSDGGYITLNFGEDNILTKSEQYAKEYNPERFKVIVSNNKIAYITFG